MSARSLLTIVRSRTGRALILPLTAAVIAVWPFAWAAAHAPKPKERSTPAPTEEHRRDAQPPALPDRQPRGPDHGGSKNLERRSESRGDSAHVHAPVAPEYRTAHVPAAAWTNDALLARGRDIYAARCAACHGERGDGNGPAATNLSVKPPSFRDAKMVGEMAGNYWFWRVSEGGLVEPFSSTGSAMPAWKEELSVEDRWAVIAYTHRFSGHDGPHVMSEHPQLLMAGHGADGDARGIAATSRPKPPTAGSMQGSHEHGHGNGGAHGH